VAAALVGVGNGESSSQSLGQTSVHSVDEALLDR
jgi:hypothetical protein